MAGVPGYNAMAYFAAKYPGQVVGIRQAENFRLVGPGVVACNAEDRDGLARLFEQHQFASVLDCAGNCALKQCELAPELAWRINVEGVQNLLSQTVPRGVRLVHLSCDLVFSGDDGRGGYVETDPTDPVTVYGKTMVAGEEAILAADPAACILRISLPMGVSFNGHAGAIDWIASRFKKSRPATLYFDEIRTPTYADCLNRLCETMLANRLERHFPRRRAAAADPLPDRADHQPRGRIRPRLPDGHSASPGRPDPAAGGQRVHGFRQADRRAGLRSVRPLALLRLARCPRTPIGTASDARRALLARTVAPRFGQQPDPAGVARVACLAAFSAIARITSKSSESQRPRLGGVRMATATVDLGPVPALWNRRHLLGLEDLSAEEITLILDKAEVFKQAMAEGERKIPLLTGKTCVNLFFENSTRTRNSFALGRPAAGGRHARFLRLDQQPVEGRDVHRHGQEHRGDGHRPGGGAASHAGHAPPAGPKSPLRRDQRRRRPARTSHPGPAGHHDHPPAQGPAGRADRGPGGRHRPQPHGPLEHLGPQKARRPRDRLRPVDVGLAPLGRVGRGVFATAWTTILPRVDVLNLLRIQFERQYDPAVPFGARIRPSVRDGPHRLAKTKPDILILAPGPINRGVEVTPDVADGPHSAILEQVTNGVAVRMAVLWLILGR